MSTLGPITVNLDINPDLVGDQLAYEVRNAVSGVPNPDAIGELSWQNVVDPSWAVGMYSFGAGQYTYGQFVLSLDLSALPADSVIESIVFTAPFAGHAWGAAGPLQVAITPHNYPHTTPPSPIPYLLTSAAETWNTLPSTSDGTVNIIAKAPTAWSANTKFMVHARGLGSQNCYAFLHRWVAFPEQYFQATVTYHEGPTVNKTLEDTLPVEFRAVRAGGGVVNKSIDDTLPVSLAAIKSSGPAYKNLTDRLDVRLQAIQIEQQNEGIWDGLQINLSAIKQDQVINSLEDTLMIDLHATKRFASVQTLIDYLDVNLFTVDDGGIGDINPMGICAALFLGTIWLTHTHVDYVEVEFDLVTSSALDVEATAAIWLGLVPIQTIDSLAFDVDVEVIQYTKATFLIKAEGWFIVRGEDVLL